ncbi:MAG: phage baseplate assembly protein V [Rhodospirillaceae bacterium]|nr:MAG: phage baseplate assembly protein V [Rhodospirillaceae bacterium]
MKEALRDLTRRMRMAIAKVVLSGVDDIPGLQSVQVRLMADEAKGGLTHLQHYAFSSNPHPEAEGVAFFVGGNRDHGVVLNLDDRRYRPRNLKTGEAILYTDEDQLAGSHRIHFKRGQEIDIFAGKKVTIRVGDTTRLELTPGGVTLITPDFQADQS